jgi:hypothetical protein
MFPTMPERLITTDQFFPCHFLHAVNFDFLIIKYMLNSHRAHNKQST